MSNLDQHCISTSRMNYATSLNEDHVEIPFFADTPTRSKYNVLDLRKHHITFRTSQIFHTVDIYDGYSNRTKAKLALYDAMEVGATGAVRASYSDVSVMTIKTGFLILMKYSKTNVNVFMTRTLEYKHQCSGRTGRKCNLLHLPLVITFSLF